MKSKSSVGRRNHHEFTMKHICFCFLWFSFFFFFLHVKQPLKTTHKILDHSEKGEVSAMINREDLLEKVVFERSGYVGCK